MTLASQSLRRMAVLLMLSLVLPALGPTPLVSDAIAGDTPGQTLSDDEQYARQARFRSLFDFLSTSPFHLARLDASGGHPEAYELFGIPMTQEEFAELERRRMVMSRAIDVKRAVTGRSFDEVEEALEGAARLSGSRFPTGPLFGGLWQDHQDGGRLKLAVTDLGAVDRTALYGLFPRGEKDLLILEQGYSLDELYEWRTLLRDRLNRAGAVFGIGFHYSDDGLRILVEFYPSDQVVDVLASLSGIPEDIVVVEFSNQVPIDLSDPANTHSSSNQQAGLQIGVWGSGWGGNGQGWCTWGMSGHTASYTYVVTAGHCATGHGTSMAGWGLRYVTQNYEGADRITISTTPQAFVYARNKDSGATLDHARISSPRANTNCTHGEILNWLAHCEYPITKRLSWYGHEVGDYVCASLGATNDYNCGIVGHTDWEFDIWQPGVGWVTVYGRIRVDGLNAGPGDSGAGVLLGNTLHGLMTNGIPGQWIAFEPAYFVKAYIGATSFDFNCVKSGSWWAACPVVYD